MPVKQCSEVVSSRWARYEATAAGCHRTTVTEGADSTLTVTTVSGDVIDFAVASKR